MRQSTIIFGTLILAFIVYITMRGQLPQYVALFSSEKSSVTPPNTASKSSDSKPKQGIDWEGVTNGDWGAIGDLLQTPLPKVGM